MLEFDWYGVPVKLSIFDHMIERMNRRSPGGRPLERMRLEAFQELMAEYADHGNRIRHAGYCWLSRFWRDRQATCSVNSAFGHQH